MPTLQIIGNQVVTRIIIIPVDQFVRSKLCHNSNQTAPIVSIVIPFRARSLSNTIQSPFLVISFDSVRFRLLSWNIDGLDERNTVERANAVCCFIKAKLPHAVFLQEVVDSTWAEVVKELNDIYDCYSPESKAPYYVAVLVHKASVKVAGCPDVLEFTSNMGRQLFQVPITFAGANILLMTSHLESTRDCGPIRQRQLRVAFNIMKDICAQKKRTPVSCLFGGDLNLRDQEVRNVGVPPGMVDVWEACGSPPTEKFTWDVKENDNLDWPHSHKPSLRFDRLYLMPEKGAGLVVPPPTGEGAKDRFVLVGKVRLSKCGGRFPSDHWGVWAEFDVQKPQ